MLDRTRTLNAEERALVVARHGNGSARTVALEFGVTRNVVIGLWRRSGKATKRPEGRTKEKPVRRNKGFVLFNPQPMTRTEQLRKIARCREEAARIADSLTSAPLPKTAIGFMDARLCHCRFVVGNGSDGLAVFCGDAVERGSWCKQHRATVFEGVSA